MKARTHENQWRKLPYDLVFQARPTSEGTFQVVDSRGEVWADCIPSELAARVFAQSAKLLLNYDDMLSELDARMSLIWDFGMDGPDNEELMHSSPEILEELEERYPGAHDYACWLEELRTVSRAARQSEWESPVEVPPNQQAELFE